jgi:hypothetical protein
MHHINEKSAEDEVIILTRHEHGLLQVAVTSDSNASMLLHLFRDLLVPLLCYLPASVHALLHQKCTSLLFKLWSPIRRSAIYLLVAYISIQECLSQLDLCL